MSEQISVRIITPKDLVFNKSADEVILPAVKGGIAILPDRAPLFLELAAGKMIVAQGDKTEVLYITSGVAEVSDNKLNVMVETAIAEKDVNVAALQERLAKVQATLKEQTSPMVIAELESHIAFIEKVQAEVKG